MKKEDALALSENALGELARQLESGKSEELTNLLETMSRFHKYSFGNCLLILRQRPGSTIVAGFHAWKKLGRSVKKGEKGICILAPMVRKEESEEKEETSKVFGYRAVYVFDVSQTEGEELPDINQISGEPGEVLGRLHETVHNFGIELSEEDDLGGADGISKGGQIVLRTGLSPAEAFNTLAHELGHELLHRGPDRAKLSRSFKELEAEAVAFVVSKSVGLENALMHSADYIQSHEVDTELLAKSLERIQRTASLIIVELESDKPCSLEAAR